MPTSSDHDPSFGDLPAIEIQLNIGESLRIGNRILRVIDIEGEETMLKIEPSDTENESGYDDSIDQSRWFDLPR